jgi:hypothetical protein
MKAEVGCIPLTHDLFFFARLLRKIKLISVAAPPICEDRSIEDQLTLSEHENEKYSSSTQPLIDYCDILRTVPENLAVCYGDYYGIDDGT